MNDCDVNLSEAFQEPSPEPLMSDELVSAPQDQEVASEIESKEANSTFEVDGSDGDEGVAKPGGLESTMDESTFPDPPPILANDLESHAHSSILQEYRRDCNVIEDECLDSLDSEGPNVEPLVRSHSSSSMIESEVVCSSSTIFPSEILAPPISQNEAAQISFDTSPQDVQVLEGVNSQLEGELSASMKDEGLELESLKNQISFYDDKKYCLLEGRSPPS